MNFNIYEGLGTNELTANINSSNPIGDDVIVISTFLFATNFDELTAY